MKEFKISIEILILSVINIYLTNLWSKSTDDKSVEVKIIRKWSKFLKARGKII